jgi:hypothetical protein
MSTIPSFAPNPRTLWPDDAVAPLMPKDASFFSQSLVEELWQLPDAQNDFALAKESAFIKGIAENKLDPRAFGVYQLQDAAYLAQSKVQPPL